MSEKKITAKEVVAGMLAAIPEQLGYADEFIREHSPEQLVKFWEVVQTEYKNPHIEAMSLFAQLAFMQAFVRVHGGPVEEAPKASG